MSVRGGRYELIRSIASGGMATVHLGRALGAGGFERLVAIKVMHAHLAEEPEFVAMFLDEARLAATIRHPNVVGTIDIQQDDEGFFLVMDYVEGPSLQRVLRAVARRQRGGLPLDVALRIFVDALAGLHAAHETCGPDGEPLHLVHRDVSPQNILIGVDGVAKITDFGVARAESRLMTTRVGTLKGKVCYMAPEQILGEPLDRRTDVYAAGVLLWELLTGHRLIRGENDGAMMQRAVRGQHQAPREVISSVPEAISAVCMRAISASPDDRFSSAAAFAEAVEAAAASEGLALATPRMVSAYVKALVLEHAEPGAAFRLGAAEPSAASATAKSVEVPPPSSRVQVVTAATAAPSSHTAVTAPEPEAPPRRSALRWAGPGGVALLGVAGWLLFTWGPLKVSWRDAEGPPAVTASATRPGGEGDGDRGTVPDPKASPPSASSIAVTVGGNPPRQGIAPLHSGREPTPRAPAEPVRSPAPSTSALAKPRANRSEADPASFRPKDL
jgi:serine/threonine-protein kinase